MMSHSTWHPATYHSSIAVLQCYRRSAIAMEQGNIWPPWMGSNLGSTSYRK